MSSITTKYGDGGNTRLYSGETVSKKSKRIWGCGDIDELVSVIGLAYSMCIHSSIVFENETSIFLCNEIEYIQKNLFTVASEIATLEPRLSELKIRIDSDKMEELDAKEISLEKLVILPKGFILPGKNIVSAQLDIARSVSRRCERIITDLYNEGFIENKYILMWMNRLSDYIYLLARYSENNSYRLVKG